MDNISNREEYGGLLISGLIQEKGFIYFLNRENKLIKHVYFITTIEANNTIDRKLGLTEKEYYEMINKMGVDCRSYTIAKTYIKKQRTYDYPFISEINNFYSKFIYFSDKEKAKKVIDQLEPLIIMTKLCD